jgi:hypothetical protein
VLLTKKEITHDFYPLDKKHTYCPLFYSEEKKGYRKKALVSIKYNKKMKQGLQEFLLEKGYDTTAVEAYVNLKVKSRVRTAWISAFIGFAVTVLIYNQMYLNLKFQYEAESREMLKHVLPAWNTPFAPYKIQEKHSPKK